MRGWAFLGIFRTLLNEIQNGRKAFLATVVGGNSKTAIGAQSVIDSQGKTLADDSSLSLSWPAIDIKYPGVHLLDSQGESLEVLIEPFSPLPALLVFGSGHIAEYLVSIGRLLSYKVIVIDDRPEYANKEKFPMADEIYCGDFAEMIRRIPLHEQSYAVLVTRGHRTDAVCLANLLDKPVPYIGMVGSKRKIRSIFTLLQESGLDPASRENVYAPVGLDMDSETPQEIALSILAELQLIRFGGTGKPLSTLFRHEKIHPHDDRRMRQDFELLEAIGRAEETEKPFAAVTIIKTEGHVPRGVGSRMVVWEDGSIYRTIGGGRRENEIIELARKSLQTGQIFIDEVEFSGSYDSFQPVCGGRYTFFVKPYFPASGSREK